MERDYDVIVAGAGPAGLQCARDVAARGYDVAVLEREDENDFPSTSNKSTGGTFPSMMASFGIPDDVVMKFTDKVVLESPNSHYTQEHPGAVLEFAEFKQFLVDDAREKGTEFVFGTQVSEPLVEDGQVTGVRCAGGDEITAYLTVDATGPGAVLAQKVGVVDLERTNQAVGVEYEYEGVDLNPEGYANLNGAMMLRLDHGIAPGGYAWIFHTGGDTAKVGVCYIQNERYHDFDDGKTIDDYLHDWLDEDPRFENAERIGENHHRGSAHIQEPQGMSTAGFMAVGDTVPSVDPVWGEGINKCMRSGRMAAVTADKCLTAGIDVSEETVSTYDDLWHDEVAPRVGSRLTMTRLLYLVSNDRYDRLMKDLNSADDETLKKANNGSKRAIMKLLHLGDIPTLMKFGKQRMSG
ncbi:MAG: NAD(P)/FAD-dependent oxidoreductase [Halobacteriales archaeon]|nr:NAD(P)/FAD-dependent oxidoreductase [Halobacteriales archaeon]